MATAALNHFTTWDDPRLWALVTDFVTSPKRLAFLHQAEAAATAQNVAANAQIGNAQIDVTSVLNQNGIPTSNSKVLVSADLQSNNVKITITNGGIDWSGTLSLSIQK